jgi:hypothetical protein
MRQPLSTGGPPARCCGAAVTVRAAYGAYTLTLYGQVEVAPIWYLLPT